MTMTEDGTRTDNGADVATKLDLTTTIGEAQSSLVERIHALEVAQATQAAAAGGAEATQAAVTTGMQATQAAMQAGTWSTITAGVVGLVMGMVMGAFFGAKRG